MIVTLQLAVPWQSYFQALRDRYFPAHRNIVPAHITLFHALPGDDVAQAEQAIAQAVSNNPFIEITILPPYSIGSGVAFGIESPDLLHVRASIATVFTGLLRPQDAQRYRPHLTVQNKVSVEDAKRSLAVLSEGFSPIDTQAAHLALWRYDNGPWTFVKNFCCEIRNL